MAEIMGVDTSLSSSDKQKEKELNSICDVAKTLMDIVKLQQQHYAEAAKKALLKGDTVEISDAARKLYEAGKS